MREEAILLGETDGGLSTLGYPFLEWESVLMADFFQIHQERANHGKPSENLARSYLLVEASRSIREAVIVVIGETSEMMLTVGEIVGTV